MSTILEKWQITAEELTKIVEDNPSYNIFVGSLTASSRVAIQLVA